jgi:hypothetical protein
MMGGVQVRCSFVDAREESPENLVHEGTHNHRHDGMKPGGEQDTCHLFAIIFIN